MSHPTFEQSTRIASRVLGVSAGELAEAFQRAVETDLPEIVAFRRDNLALSFPDIDPAYLAWRYRFGRDGHGLGDLWLLRARGRLVGILGTEDLRIRHPGGVARGVRTMDILVERRQQSSGLGVWLNQAMFRNSQLTLAVGANEHSIGTVRRLFDALPSMCLWVMPVDVGRYMRRRLGDNAPVRFAAEVANSALSAWRHFAASSASEGLDIRPVAAFDASFEALLRACPSNEIRVERSLEQLNYRMFKNPRALYRVTGAFRANLPVGYVGWRILRRADGDLLLHIIDWRAEPEARERILMELFRRLRVEARVAGCTMLMLYQQSRAEAQTLARAGFIGPRPGRDRIVGLHASTPDLSETLGQRNWGLTDLDDDNDGQ